MSESHRKVKLNVRVPSSKKEEWKDSLDEDGTLSALVRRAVDKELSDEYLPRDAVEAMELHSGKQDIDLTEVTGRLSELQRTAEAIEGKVDTLSSGDARTEEGDIEELAMDLLPRLPSYPHDVPQHVLEALGGKGEMDDREYIRYLVESSRHDSELEIDGSAQRFAREIRESTPVVREALLYLEDKTTENIKSAVYDGTRHWMRL